MKNIGITIYVDKPVTFIQNFFKDKKASDQFLEIAKYLMEKDENLIIRTDCAIIGLSYPGERYWCYAVQKESVWKIKFKHHASNIPISGTSRDEFRVRCDECYDYYNKNKSEFLIGVAKCPDGPDVQTVSEENEHRVQIKADIKDLCDEESDREDARRRVAELDKKVFKRECYTCKLHYNDKCSEWKDIVCDDYIPRYQPSQEELAVWPTHGDATATDSEHGKRYFEGQST